MDIGKFEADLRDLMALHFMTVRLCATDLRWIAKYS